MQTVRELLEKKPELVCCIAKQPPKSDDGQSPLQVALKNGCLEIADLLLDKGADVNFMESSDCCNLWRAPVLHDAINAAVMCSRWNTSATEIRPFTVFSTKERADQALAVLKRMILLGADVNATDSFGNTGLIRATLQARQILPEYNHAEKKVLADRVFTDELRLDLQRIFDLLIESGADVECLYRVDSKIGKSCAELFENEPVTVFWCR